jgi:opacity protein-like surface antigen
MNKTLVLGSLLALSTSVMAMDVNYFVGAGAERVDLKGNASAPSVKIDGDFKDTGYVLKAGAILNKTHRLSLSYGGYSDDGMDLYLTKFNYDYIFPLENKFSFLVGAHLGNAKFKDSEAKLNGFLYGAQTGILYDITSNIQLETSIAYTHYDIDKTINYSGTDINVELEHSTAFYLGFNYKF